MARTSPQATAALALAIALLTAPPALALVKGPSTPRPADPYADPKDDPYNPLGYIASNALTTVALHLIAVSFIAHAFCLYKWKAWWMSCMVIGELTFGAGIACRYGLHVHPESTGVYIAEYLLVVLSPCAFIAADYILLGHLASHLQGDAHLPIRPRRIRILFLLSDLTTLSVQGLGGNLSLDAKTDKVTVLGNRQPISAPLRQIVLAGLVLQLISFCIFAGVFLRFVLRMRRYSPELWARDAGKRWYNDCRALVYALAVSSVGIILCHADEVSVSLNMKIRSVYRVIENAQGFKGPLSRSEPLFYLLDTLPLWLSVVVYAPFWPGRLMRPDSETFDQMEMEAAAAAAAAAAADK
ncbi:hypothetical protein BV25DRAFT_1914863 [Artomyces pyxidatus]|uniref:Uncharacterized protein n=1 Tax=Artomyces pyxidatus TaxID=48021 RepID=A0ACB8T758_9AGAM|nr:hypothetical protein BV25DRAFT_1914863 [Artomyces pyxidatus]